MPSLSAPAPTQLIMMKLKVCAWYSFWSSVLLVVSTRVIMFSLLLSDLLVVNLTYPERNREVQLYCFNSLSDPVSGDIVDGFQIVMPVDIRDFEEDLFKLEIVQDNELLLHMPALPYQMQYDIVQRHAGLNKLRLLNPRCQQAQEICITDIDSMPSRKLKKLRLRFPENVCLVNLASVLDAVISPEIEPYSYMTNTFSADGTASVQWVCSISWQVGNAATRSKAFGSAKKSGASKLSALFRSMSTTE